VQEPVLAQLVTKINDALDIIFLIILGVGIVVVNIRVAISMAGKEIKKARKNSKTKSGRNDELVSSSTLIARIIFLWLIWVIPEAFIIGLIWLLLVIFSSMFEPATTIWTIITCASIITVYLYTKKHGGYRGLTSAIGHLTILLLGWSLGKWLGIIFISLPFIALYYYLLYRLAEVVIPASDPDISAEKWQRFKIFVGYMWGTQYPIIIVPNRPNAKAETRINGSVFQTFKGAPGYIWTNAYQVVGLTAGTNFSRVEGPGAIYTRRFERVKEVMDLRTQLQTKEIDAITQNGIPIRATLFVSFRIDGSPIEKTIRHRLRYAGSFPYSRPRVQAVLSMEGVSATPSSSGNPALRWDDQVMSQIEETTRRVIAETSLEELWYPGRQDGKEISSLDLIAVKIRDRLADFLQKHSILLYSARIVHYALRSRDVPGQLDEISIDRLPIWKSRLEKISNKKVAEVNAEVEQKQLDAAVVASTMLLKSIAESLKNTNTVKVGFSRYLIAMRYLNIVYDMVQEQPKLRGEKISELMQKISILRGY